MIKEYLKKLQELQMDTLDTNVNISVQTRYNTEKNYPWIVVTVTVEGVSLDKSYLSVFIYGNMYKTEEQNERHQAIEYEKVADFVKDALTIRVQRQRFYAAYERALRIQRACLLKEGVRADLETPFCKDNYKESGIDAWTIALSVIIDQPDGDRMRMQAEWYAWREDGEFVLAAENIERELKRVGVTV